MKTGKQNRFLTCLLIVFSVLISINSVGNALAVSMDSTLSASQDGYSNLAQVVVGRTTTIEATLSITGGDSVTVNNWNFQITPDSYTLQSQASVGTVTSSSKPTWTVIFNQPGTYTVSISPSCSAATCNGDSLTLEAQNPPVLTVITSSVTLNGGSSVVVSFTVKNTGEATAKGVTASITTPSGVSATPETQTVTEPGLASGSISSNGVVTQTFTLTGAANQVVDGSTFTIHVSSINDGSASASGTIHCNTNCYSSSNQSNNQDNQNNGGSTGGSSTGTGATPTITQETQQTLTTIPGSPSLEFNQALVQAITQQIESFDMQALIESANDLKSYIDITRHYSQSNGFVTINETLTYDYELPAKTLLLYSKLPKTFASNADNVTVKAFKNNVLVDNVTIVEQDPSFLAVFSNVNKSDVLKLVFKAESSANSSVIQEQETEVYALFEQPVVVKPSITNVTQQQLNITENKTEQPVVKESKESLAWLWILIGIVVALIVVVFITRKPKKPKRGHAHESMLQTLKQEMQGIEREVFQHEAEKR